MPSRLLGQHSLVIPKWFDLPVYESVWQHVSDWLSASEPHNETWCITASDGCGKTLLCNEIRKRNISRRIKLFHVEFKPGLTIGLAELLQEWSRKIHPLVELPEWVKAGDKLQEWLELAIESLTFHGYFVRLAVEADRLDRQAANLSRQHNALFLCRSPFRGLSGSDLPILPPWSEGDIAEVLKQISVESGDQGLEPGRIWNLTRGCPRDVIRLLDAGKERYSGLSQYISLT